VGRKAPRLFCCLLFRSKWLWVSQSQPFVRRPRRCTLVQMNSPLVSKEAIIEALKTIEDPDLFIDIYFLGLIYSINIDEGAVAIDMTFTTPLCPSGPQLKHEVQTKVGALPGVASVTVTITFTPPWQPSEEVKGLLGMM